MKELKSDLSKVKVGDWVCTAQHGWCKVKTKNKDDCYYQVGIEIGIENKEVKYDSYTLNGLHNTTDTYPTCFPADQVPEEYVVLFGPPPVEFKDGEPVWVSDDETVWCPRVFKEFQDGRYYTYGIDAPGSWKYCRKWEDMP